MYKRKSSFFKVITFSRYAKYVFTFGHIFIINLSLLCPTLRLIISLCTDFSLRQIENASILSTSWQRPVLMIDPYEEGALFLKYIHDLEKKDTDVVQISMDTR